MPAARGVYYDVFTDRRGDVLAGATVTFTGAAGGAVYAAASGGVALASATADANGAVNVYPEADRYTVVATLTGYTSVTKVVDVSAPPSSVVSGSAVDESGNPVTVRFNLVVANADHTILVDIVPVGVS